MRNIFARLKTSSLPLDHYGDVRSLAQIFNWFTVAILIALAAGLPITLSTNDTRTAFIIAGGLPFVLASFIFTRRGQFEWAAIFLALVLLSLITLVATNGLGIHHLSNLGYPVILIVASLVMRKRTMFFLTLFAVGCVAWLVFGELAGAFTPTVLKQSVPGDFFAATLIIVVTAVMVRLVSEALFKSHRELQQELREHKLTEAKLEEDIALRLQAEALLKESLREKETLLKEVHHRVKNNMQVIVSILNLQASYVADPVAQEILRDGQHRVRSMALVHEQLYKSKNLAQIDFRDYLQHLASTLLDSYSTHTNRIRLTLDVGEVALGVEAAIPCGLIASELISNALKHAFPHNQAGELLISLQPAPDGLWALHVQDNGVGFPEGKDWWQMDSLGMQLVQSLIKQLHGTAELTRLQPGTRFTIQFKPEG